MKRALILFIYCCMTTMAHAEETTVYETQDSQGIPTFSNIPERDNTNAKEIIIDTPDTTAASQTNTATEPTDAVQPLAPPSSTLQPLVGSTTEPHIDEENHNIAEQMSQENNQLNALKKKWENAIANEKQATENLNKARESMREGDYTIGGDQFIDQDYIKDLQEDQDTAKNASAVAKETYEQARQKAK